MNMELHRSHYPLLIVCESYEFIIINYVLRAGINDAQS
jgi:hypothetical protein